MTNKLPTPVKTDSRICFAIYYFKTEEEAEQYNEYVQERGFTYNGGFYHGRPCGRDTSWDYEDKELGPLYAVTR